MGIWVVGFKFIVEQICSWIFASVNNIFIVEILIWIRRGLVIFIIHRVFHIKIIDIFICLIVI